MNSLKLFTALALVAISGLYADMDSSSKNYEGYNDWRSGKMQGNGSSWEGHSDEDLESKEIIGYNAVRGHNSDKSKINRTSEDAWDHSQKAHLNSHENHKMNSSSRPSSGFNSR